MTRWREIFKNELDVVKEKNNTCQDVTFDKVSVKQRWMVYLISLNIACILTLSLFLHSRGIQKQWGRPTHSGTKIGKEFCDKKQNWNVMIIHNIGSVPAAFPAKSE